MIQKPLFVIVNSNLFQDSCGSYYNNYCFNNRAVVFGNNFGKNK
jgi:hypothetical protein